MYQDEIIACLLIEVLFLGGYGLACLLGLGVMKVLDRRTGKRKWWIVGRCL